MDISFSLKEKSDLTSRMINEKYEKNTSPVGAKREKKRKEKEMSPMIKESSRNIDKQFVFKYLIFLFSLIQINFS
jgi:hypothetical protein